MFGRKKPKLVEDATFWGWHEKDIRYLAERFAKERPHLGMEISGICHITKFRGDEFAASIAIARSQEKVYGKFALAFDDRPASEDSLSLTTHEHELVGFTPYPRARMCCSFGVGNVDEVKGGRLGGLSLSGFNASETTPAHSIIEAHLDLQSVEQEVGLRQTMQAALVDGGSAHINFMLSPIDDAGEWAERFMKDGYSPGVKISGAYAISKIGRDFF